MSCGSGSHTAAVLVYAFFFRTCNKSRKWKNYTFSCSLSSFRLGPNRSRISSVHFSRNKIRVPCSKSAPQVQKRRVMRGFIMTCMKRVILPAVYWEGSTRVDENVSPPDELIRLLTDTSIRYYKEMPCFAPNKVKFALF